MVLRNATRKINIPIFLGLFLLCLTMISTYFTGGIYAKYTVRDSASDSARVATFNVNITSDIDSYVGIIPLGDIQPGDSKQIQFAVTNKSEVVVEFSVTVVNKTGNLPLNVPVKGTPKADTPIVTSVLSPDSSDTVDLSVSWPAEHSDPSYAGKSDILELKVSAVQID